ncbi:MAG: TolC family protein [Synergistaceae bacterium]|nr:TolC family protein [Synergistaceae bacterium]
MRAETEVPVLTLEECLTIAETNHPSVAGAEAQAAAGRGKLNQILAADRPEISATASTARNGSDYNESTNHSVGATASLKIFDAKRNKYTADAQRNTLSATEEEGRKTVLDVRANVKSSYMALLLSAETAAQRLESVRAFERHLERAQGFYEVGTKPWYDVTKARVDLGNAQLSLVEAHAGVEVAKAALRNAMGVDQETLFDAAPVSLDLSAASAGELWNLSHVHGFEELERLALENRADYRASELRTLAGRSTLSAEARAASPSVSLTGGCNGAGDDVSELEKSWNVGLRMSVPVIDGGAAKARADMAQAQLSSLAASREKLRQDISLEVRRAYTEIVKARERVRISELTLANAEENRKLALGRYETGVGDSLEVTDALLSYASARLENRKARYDFQTALIDTEKAIGMEFLSH